MEYRENVLKESKRFTGEKFWRKPVSGFGDSDARLLIVGLAPAATGANRTGRVFTGDKSSDILVSALHSIGLANRATSIGIGDGLQYTDAFVSLAVRCVPPDNKPTNAEIANCLPYLESEAVLLTNIRSIVALGTIAFNSVKSVFRNQGFQVNGMKFSHGKFYEIDGKRLYGCYHPSPRNINTGRTTPEGIRAVLKDAHGYALSSRS